jgi:2-(1,2-epoxy-1,2-dihydrophenyl)acetyl-CoA isomerase
MSSQILSEQREPGICTITLNRPAEMNPVNKKGFSELLSAFNTVAMDESVRVVILEGAGENFSAGADIALLDDINDSSDSLEIMELVKRVILALRGLPQPVVSKVSGVAYGFGANLALASDFVVASKNARFCQVFINIGIIPDGGGHFFLPRLVGLTKARELAMLGKKISGEEAAEIGLIYKSVPEDDLDREVGELAQELAMKSPKALAWIKQGLDQSFHMSLEDMLEWEAESQSIALLTPEHKAAISRLSKKKDTGKRQ